MNNKNLIKKVCANLVLKKLERYVPIILKLDPKNLPQVLMKMKKEDNLTNEIIGDFIQKLLIEKYGLHKKKPEFKDAILNFSKENHIRGLRFHYL